MPQPTGLPDSAVIVDNIPSMPTQELFTMREHSLEIEDWDGVWFIDEELRARHIPGEWMDVFDDEDGE